MTPSLMANFKGEQPAVSDHQFNLLVSKRGVRATHRIGSKVGTCKIRNINAITYIPTSISEDKYQHFQFSE